MIKPFDPSDDVNLGDRYARGLLGVSAAES